MSAKEMLELADKIAAVKLDQLHSTWPTVSLPRVSETERELIVNVLRRLAAQSDAAGDGPVAWQVKGPGDRWLHAHPVQLDRLRSEGMELRPLYAHPHAVPQTARETIARIINPVAFVIDEPRMKDSETKAAMRGTALRIADSILAALSGKPGG